MLPVTVGRTHTRTANDSSESVCLAENSARVVLAENNDKTVDSKRLRWLPKQIFIVEVHTKTTQTETHLQESVLPLRVFAERSQMQKQDRVAPEAK